MKDPPQAAIEDVPHQRALARSRNARDSGQRAEADGDVEVLEVVLGDSGQLDRSGGRRVDLAGSPSVAVAVVAAAAAVACLSPQIPSGERLRRSQDRLERPG